MLHPPVAFMNPVQDNAKPLSKGSLNDPVGHPSQELQRQVQVSDRAGRSFRGPERHLPDIPEYFVFNAGPCHTPILTGDG